MPHWYAIYSPCGWHDSHTRVTHMHPVTLDRELVMSYIRMHKSRRKRDGSGITLQHAAATRCNTLQHPATHASCGGLAIPFATPTATPTEDGLQHTVFGSLAISSDNSFELCVGYLFAAPLDGTRFYSLPPFLSLLFTKITHSLPYSVLLPDSSHPSLFPHPLHISLPPSLSPFHTHTSSSLPPLNFSLSLFLFLSLAPTSTFRLSR